MYAGTGQKPLSRIIFDRHDTDRNGSLDSREFHSMVSSLTLERRRPMLKN